MVLVSPASLWESAIKISLGKYELPYLFAEFWEEQLVQNNFTLLPISVAHVSKVIDMPFHHRDPFDRLIIAQAQVEKIPVVSSYNCLDLYGVERIW